MSKWLDDDLKEETLKTAKGDDSIFTEDDFFEFNESEKPSEEDIELAELGIRIKETDLYRKTHKTETVFHNGKLTKEFFIWYLGMCDSNLLKTINRKKLPKKFQELLDVAEPHGLGMEEPVWKDDKEDFMKIASLAGTRKQYLKFFWDFMGRALDPNYEVNDVEIEMLENIKEDLK